MSIETARLILRTYEERDLAALTALLGDAETMAFWPSPFTPEQSAMWLWRNIERRAESIYGRRAVVLKATGELIGDAGVVRAELAGEERDDLGYIIHRMHWGRGYATEAAQALARHYLLVHGLPALYANMAHDHAASRRVAERIGMRRAHTFANPRNRGILSYLYVLERQRE
jgi:RimJ/RimL family protein N-acetyltransferase